MINIYKHGDAQDSHVSLPEGNHKFDVLPLKFLIVSWFLSGYLEGLESRLINRC